MFTDSAIQTETIVKVLQPDKFFSAEAKKDLKIGDQFEVCPGAVQMTQNICSLIELSKGAALVIDYGEDHAFSNSFRVSIASNWWLWQGIKDHKLVKDYDAIIRQVGTLDLTAYVNFQQIQQIARMNKQLKVMPIMPQGQFLECMGIRLRLETLQQKSNAQ